MLIYNELKNKPREFLAATGLKVDEFETFAWVSACLRKVSSSPDAGRENRLVCRSAAAPQGHCRRAKTSSSSSWSIRKLTPCKRCTAYTLGLVNPKPTVGIHRLLPVLQQALRTLGEAPERDARRVATSELARAGGPNLTID